jgi:hypothetical protein
MREPRRAGEAVEQLLGESGCIGWPLRSHATTTTRARSDRMMPSLFATVRNEADNTASTPERLCRLSVAIGALPPAVFRFRDSASPDPSSSAGAGAGTHNLQRRGGAG